MNKVQNSYSWAGLCKDCRHAHILETARGHRLIECHARYSDTPLRFEHPVQSCNYYRPNDGPDLDAFEKIAWRVSTDTKSGRIGFISPEAWRKKEEKED